MWRREIKTLTSQLTTYSLTDNLERKEQPFVTVEIDLRLAEQVKSVTRPPVTHPVTAQTATQRRRAYIITVGIGANQSQWDLSFAVQSATDVARTLRERLRAEYEVTDLQLVSAREADSPKVALKQATKENIRAVFDLLAGKPVSTERLADFPATITRNVLAASPDDLVLDDVQLPVLLHFTRKR